MRLRAVDLEKTYQAAAGALEVLCGVSFELESGQWLGLAGPSGAGKTTLLHIVGTLEAPSRGSVWADDTDLSKLNGEALGQFRRRSLGIVYQSAELISRFSVWQNVAVSLIPEGVPARHRRARSQALLERLGMAHKLDEAPRRLSGGERQRVAIARALIQQPRFVLADEPTNQVDPTTKSDILELFQELRQDGVGFLLASHETDVMAKADRVLELAGGRLAGSC